MASSQMVTMQQATPTPPREPLGAPRGSVRGILTLMLTVTLWYLVLNGNIVPHYLFDTAYMAILFYFGVRSNPGVTSGAQKQPLHLPRWFIRGFIVAGFIGIAAYLWTRSGSVPGEISVIVDVLIGFVAGAIVSAAVHRVYRDRVSAFNTYGNVKAVVCILAVAGLCVAALMNAELPYIQQVIDSLAILVAFYFGSRSV